MAAIFWQVSMLALPYTIYTFTQYLSCFKLSCFVSTQILHNQKTWICHPIASNRFIFCAILHMYTCQTYLVMSIPRQPSSHLTNSFHWLKPIASLPTAIWNSLFAPLLLLTADHATNHRRRRYRLVEKFARRYRREHDLVWSLRSLFGRTLPRVTSSRL